jgi:hypothetical protein
VVEAELDWSALDSLAVMALLWFWQVVLNQNL